MYMFNFKTSCDYTFLTTNTTDEILLFCNKQNLGRHDSNPRGWSRNKQIVSCYKLLSRNIYRTFELDIYVFTMSLQSKILSLSFLHNIYFKLILYLYFWYSSSFVYEYICFIIHIIIWFWILILWFIISWFHGLFTRPLCRALKWVTTLSLTTIYDNLTSAICPKIP